MVVRKVAGTADETADNLVARWAYWTAALKAELMVVYWASRKAELMVDCWAS